MMGADTTTQSAPEDTMPIARRSTRSAAEKALVLKRKLHELGAKRGTIAALDLKDGRPFDFYGRADDPFLIPKPAVVKRMSLTQARTYEVEIQGTGETWYVYVTSPIWARELTTEEAEAVLWADSRAREIEDIRTSFKGLEISNCLAAIASTESDLAHIRMTAAEHRQATWRLEAFRGLLEDAKQAEVDRVAALSDEELNAVQGQASRDAVELKRRVEAHLHDMRYWGKRGGSAGQRNAVKYAEFAQTADFQREEACIIFDLTVVEKNRREEQARTDEIAQAAFITPSLELASADWHALKCISVLNYLGDSRGIPFSTRTIARQVNAIIIREWSVHRALVRSGSILDRDFILRIEQYTPYEMCRLLAKIEIIFTSSGLGLAGLDAEWLERHKNVL